MPRPGAGTYAQTLTGFKWIVRAAAEDLRYGYEEALGYCVAPNHVQDKDGITAALLLAELAAGLKADHRYGQPTGWTSWRPNSACTPPTSSRSGSPNFPRSAPRWPGCGRIPPAALLGDAVSSLEKICAPDADVIVIRTPSARVVVRPSGTEPKLKAYLEVVRPVAGRP